MKNKELTPVGMFYCKGCKCHREVVYRIGKYGDKCEKCVGRKEHAK